MSIWESPYQKCLTQTPCQLCPCKHEWDWHSFRLSIRLLWLWPCAHDDARCPGDDEGDHMDDRHPQSLHCCPAERFAAQLACSGIVKPTCGASMHESAFASARPKYSLGRQGGRLRLLPLCLKSLQCWCSLCLLLTFSHRRSQWSSPADHLSWRHWRR